MNRAHTTYAAVGLGANIAVILPWLCALGHITMPAEVAVAAGGLIAAAVGCFLHRLPGTPVPPTAPGAPAQTQMRS